MTVTLREIGDTNREAVLALRVAPGQGRFVSSVRDSLRHAEEKPAANPWFRAVYDGDEPAGFVMVSWDVRSAAAGHDPSSSAVGDGSWMLWKLLVDERHQGRGLGAEIIRQVASLVRDAGGAQLLTSYVPGDDGPAGFYRRLGFVPTGEVDDGEVVARLTL
ncbi:GNAT family N-acetyltransferase [Dactylosporangium sp. NBC_01737]|uniref:GNAT family N-acetyltransferase n=1 Tax=Dactylosporangium sp. NBC_01737 TaxID=2975959 RepID=UPI002E118AC5|nr:GNAT family N-acetyltransferase [Dactylosporangium sp. NBC_01737]